MRLLSFICCLLFGVSLVLFLENRAVRRDQAAMEQAYADFLGKKLGKKPLLDAIRPDSMAVFKAGPEMVGCVLLTKKTGVPQ